mgnify:CR=1 FL=1
MYSAEPQLDYLDSALKTIFQIHKTYPPGSILVFLPTSIQAYVPDLEKSLASKGSVRLV